MSNILSSVSDVRSNPCLLKRFLLFIYSYKIVFFLRFKNKYPAILTNKRIKIIRKKLWHLSVFETLYSDSLIFSFKKIKTLVLGIWNLHYSVINEQKNQFACHMPSDLDNLGTTSYGMQLLNGRTRSSECTWQ